MTIDRSQPHSMEAEQSVLGGILIDNEAWDEVVGILADKDFYHPAHRIIFRAIEAVHWAGEPMDVVTVSDWLKRNEMEESAGGMAYLGTIARDTPSTSNIGAYAAIVKERSMLRDLIRAGHEIAEMGIVAGDMKVRDIVDQAESAILRIAEQSTARQSGFVEAGRLLAQAIDQIMDARESKDGITGLPTGLTDLDRRTKGLQKGDLVILAARPSMGKTSLAMNIAETNAFRAMHEDDTQVRGAVAVFSMEMPGAQLALRLLASMAHIDQDDLRSGHIKDEQWVRLTQAAQVMSAGVLHIDDTPAQSPNDLKARARRLKRERGLQLIIIDYIQLMHIPGYREGRTNEIAAISRSLKEMAKELDVPVIALSQLNRNLEQRPDKRPIMSDLRESGSIEQDADLILFIYRHVVYDPDIPEEEKPIAEIIIGKQRNGPIGRCRALFMGQYLRFENLAH